MSPRAAQLIADTAAAHRITPADLLGPSRFKVHVRARRQVWRTMREWGWSTTRIGAATNRDHSTVVVGLQRA